MSSFWIHLYYQITDEACEHAELFYKMVNILHLTKCGSPEREPVVPTCSSLPRHRGLLPNGSLTAYMQSPCITTKE